MTAIVGFSDLLMTANVSPDEQRQFLEAIRRNGDALLELINGILDLARIEADRLCVEEADVPFEQIIDDAVSAVRIPARQKGLALDLDCARRCRNISARTPCGFIRY